MKVSEIQKVQSALSGIRNKKLPIKMSFVLSRNLKKMDEIVADLDEKRNELLERYGEHDETGQLAVSESGSVKIIEAGKFMEEMNDALNTDIELTLDMISEADIEKCDQDGYDNLTVDEVGAMECMIVVGDET